jgi:hypothetical protein
VGSPSLEPTTLQCRKMKYCCCLETAKQIQYFKETSKNHTHAKPYVKPAEKRTSLACSYNYLPGVIRYAQRLITPSILALKAEQSVKQRNAAPVKAAARAEARARSKGKHQSTALRSPTPLFCDRHPMCQQWREITNLWLKGPVPALRLAPGANTQPGPSRAAALRLRSHRPSPPSPDFTVVAYLYAGVMSTLAMADATPSDPFRLSQR